MKARLAALILCVLVVGAIPAFLAGRATAATVERHVICWGQREKPQDWHWNVWQPQRHRWKATQRPCKALWDKRWGLLRDGVLIGIHKQRTPVSDLPDQQAGAA